MESGAVSTWASRPLSLMRTLPSGLRKHSLSHCGQARPWFSEDGPQTSSITWADGLATVVAERPRAADLLKALLVATE